MSWAANFPHYAWIDIAGISATAARVREAFEMYNTAIPTCHACHSARLPFAVSLDGATWRHNCGTVVCPACGGKPAAGDTLCGECRAITRGLTIQDGDVVYVKKLSMLTVDHVIRGGRRVGR